MSADKITYTPEEWRSLAGVALYNGHDVAADSHEQLAAALEENAALREQIAYRAAYPKE